MFTVLLDNGHGVNTPGKRSPDGKFREYAYARKVVKELYDRIVLEGYECVVITPEDYDISLSTRVNRINSVIKHKGASNCLMVSVHNNAAGMGDKWMNATGWSAWTTRGLNNSDKLADCLYDAAEEVLKPLNKRIITLKTDGDRDCESNFTIIKGANCPAVLTENFFLDNKEDVLFLESEEGFNAIVELHLQGILKFIKKKQNKLI